MAKLEEMEMGAAALKHVKWKRAVAGGKEKEFEVAIKVLTQDELDRAKVNAARRTKELDGYDDLETTEKDKLFHDSEVTELLSMSLRDPEYKDPEHTEPWAGPNALRARLLPNELGFLVNMYEAHQGEVSPPYRQMTKKQFDEIRRAIVVTGNADPLAFFASHVQRAYTVTMAVQLEALLTDKSLSGFSSSSELTTSDEKPQSDATAVSEEDPSETVLP